MLTNSYKTCCKELLFTVFLSFIIFLIFLTYFTLQSRHYFPVWAEFSKNNQPVRVMDGGSSIGRYSNHTKYIYLKDLTLINGDFCKGLIISFLELRTVLNKLFPNRIIDRTDLRIVSKNGSCWVDAASILTGARINFGTLSIDPKVGDGYIVQRISTGKTYQVKLKDGILPKELSDLEAKIESQYKNKEKISKDDIDKAKDLAEDFNKFLLNTPVNELIEITELKNYKYKYKFNLQKEFTN